MPHYPDEIEYSEKYEDENFEYRHVLLPKAIFKEKVPKGRLLTDKEWRTLGVQQSKGWVHYAIHRPEPFILMFRRARGTDPHTGLPPEGHPYYQEQVESMNEAKKDWENPEEEKIKE